MNIYIAGPFSKDYERNSLKKLIEIIKTKYPDSNIYIPMEFKVEEDYQNPDGTWHLPNYVWAHKVFEADIHQLNKADIVFGMYVGHYCSSGTVWEMGYAFGANIPVIAYIPEWVSGDMSLMLMNSFAGYIDDSGIIHDISEEFLSKYNLK